MHIAELKPEAIDEDNLEQTTIDKELNIQKELIASSGKPANVVDKILEGKMKKFYSEVTLLNHSFVLDPDKSVERELMIVTVKAEASQRDELVDHLDKVGGKVLNIGTESMMLSLVETSSVIDDFESFLSNFGIVELQRTGRVALDSL